MKYFISAFHACSRESLLQVWALLQEGTLTVKLFGPNGVQSHSKDVPTFLSSYHIVLLGFLQSRLRSLLLIKLSTLHCHPMHVWLPQPSKMIWAPCVYPVGLSVQRSTTGS